VICAVHLMAFDGKGLHRSGPFGVVVGQTFELHCGQVIAAQQQRARPGKPAPPCEHALLKAQSLDWHAGP